jgi:hypothetical protein
MDGKIDCVCIKFCVKLGNSATETPEMFCEAFGEHSLSRTAAFKGRLSQLKMTRSGRRSTSKTTENVETIRELIHKDHR